MRTIIFCVTGLCVALFACRPAAAWSHADRWGGSTSHTYGSDETTRTTGWGGSETHTYGEGTTATGRYGDTATHQQGSGDTSFSNPYGGSATHYYGSDTTTVTSPYGTTAYHPTYYGGSYPAYHPPTTVDVYGSSGCYDCGGWSTAGAAATGAVVGLAAGAAVGSAEANANNQNAYAAGYAAGSGSTAGTTYAMGGIYTTLPAGCSTPTVAGGTYYLCGNTWFQPSYGANGVYYRVVPAP